MEAGSRCRARGGGSRKRGWKDIKEVKGGEQKTHRSGEELIEKEPGAGSQCLRPEGPGRQWGHSGRPLGITGGVDDRIISAAHQKYRYFQRRDHLLRKQAASSSRPGQFHPGFIPSVPLCLFGKPKVKKQPWLGDDCIIYRAKLLVHFLQIHLVKHEGRNYPNGKLRFKPCRRPELQTLRPQRPAQPPGKKTA